MDHRPTTESAWPAGLPWPIVFEHQSMDSLAAIGNEPMTDVLRRFRVRVEPQDGGPSTPEHFARWASYHPARCHDLLATLAKAQQPTDRERLFLRVTVWSRPGDGVWDLPRREEVPLAMAEALGLVANRPMQAPYATRWDINSPSPEDYADAFIAAKPGRGVSCFVHPRLVTQVCPRLQVVLAYHALARPESRITRQEYQTMTAYEVYCHRYLRDVQARRNTTRE